jgi:hypothetical protein
MNLWKKPASLLIREDSSNACVSTTEAAIELKKRKIMRNQTPLPSMVCEAYRFTMPSAVTKRFDGKRPSCETREPFHSLHPRFGCHGRNQAWLRGSDENDPCPIQGASNDSKSRTNTQHNIRVRIRNRQMDRNRSMQ